MTGGRRYGAAVLVLQAAVLSAGLAASQADDIAVRRFETGLAFAADGRDSEALTDFEAVVELYPASTVADNALLEIARHHLEVTAALDEAAGHARRIVDDAAYSQGDAAPEAYVLLARVALARDHSVPSLDAALAQLQRGLGLWPAAPVVPQARFFVAEVHRLAGRSGAALEAYDRVDAEHATSVWAARAGLRAAVLRAVAGDPIGAMARMQRVRDRWPGSPEAETALARITILHRLYVRAPERAFRPAGEPFSVARMPRIEALVVNPEGTLFFATESGVGATDPAGAGLLPGGGGRPRALVLDREGLVTAAVRGSLVSSAAPPRQLAIRRAGEEPEALEEIEDVGVTAAGEWLVADGDERDIHRFSADGEYRGVFVPGRVRRLAVGPADRIAVIDRDDRIQLMAEARALGPVPRRGADYEIDDPVDLAYDVFGHLFVADERRVFVFGPDLELLLQFPPTEAAPGAPGRITAFALDRFGRLYVADEDTDQIVRYQ